MPKKGKKGVDQRVKGNVKVSREVEERTGLSVHVDFNVHIPFVADRE